MGIFYHSRPLLVLLALSFLFLSPLRVGAQRDAPAEPSNQMPSRIPLLDESDLAKFGNPQTNETPGMDSDEEFPADTYIPLTTTNLRYYSYFTKINHRIEQARYYPRDAAKDFLNGIVTVLIEIQRDGSISKAKIIESSGKEVLDDAALDIVQRASPFPVVPSRIRTTPLKVTTNIRFIPTQEAVQQQEGLGLAVPFK